MSSSEITYGATLNSTVRNSADFVPEDKSDDFERFQNLAAKLLAVPKSEIDDKRKKP